MLQVSGLPIKTFSLPAIKPKDGIRADARDNERQPTKQQECADVDLDNLVFCVAAAFRGHPHINNVLTHISGANWNAVEKALHVILDPRAGSHDLSPLARNIVDLMCADRGVTGRILKPFYHERLVALLGDQVASRLIAHVTSLFLESEVAVLTVKKDSLTGVDSGNGKTT
jgi:hypothetical protein